MNSSFECFMLLFICLGLTFPGRAEDTTRDATSGVEFFESQVRPLLVKRCYKCHSAKSDPIEGGLRLDSREAWRRFGHRHRAGKAG